MSAMDAAISAVAVAASAIAASAVDAIAAPAPVDVKFESTVILSSTESATLVPFSSEDLGDASQLPLDARVFPIHFAASVWPLVEGGQGIPQGPFPFKPRQCHCGQIGQNQTHVVCGLPLNSLTYSLGVGHQQLLWMTAAVRTDDKSKKDPDGFFSCDPQEGQVPQLQLQLPVRNQQQDKLDAQRYNVFRMESSSLAAPNAERVDFMAVPDNKIRCFFEGGKMQSAAAKKLLNAKTPTGAMSFPLCNLSPSVAQVYELAEFVSEFLFNPFASEFNVLFNEATYALAPAKRALQMNLRPTLNLVVSEVLPEEGVASDVPYLAMIMLGATMWAQCFSYLERQMPWNLPSGPERPSSPSFEAVLTICIDLFRRLLCQVLDPTNPAIHDFIARRMHGVMCVPLAQHLPKFLRRFVHPTVTGKPITPNHVSAAVLKTHLCRHMLKHSADAHQTSHCCSTEPHVVKVQCFCMTARQQLEIHLTNDVYRAI